MLNFFKKLSFENLKKIILEIIKRMPLSALMSLSAFGVMVTLITEENLSMDVENNLVKLLITFIILFFLSIALYVFSESKKHDHKKKWQVQIFTLLYGALFFYFFEENLTTNLEQETAVYLAMTVVGIVCFLFVSRFIKKYFVKIKEPASFYISSFELVLRFGMAWIVGMATMLLGFAALAALFALFDLDFLKEDKMFGYWASFSALFMAPMYLLAEFPKTRKIKVDKLEIIVKDKFYSFLVNYVALPAIYIYFTILYAYTIKVLLHFREWPQGEVAWLVILFSFFGYIVYFASSVFEKKYKHAEFFRKIFPASVVLQTFMLFYAIGLRINQYDLTINRYLVVIFGLWLLVLSVYYIVSKKKDLSIIFSSLFVVVIVFSIGPWSVYLLPEHRQLKTLESNLVKAGIMKVDKSIVSLDDYDDVDDELSGEIYGGIEYLCNAHGCEILDKFFASEIEELKRKDKEDWEKNKQAELEEAENRKNVDEEWVKRIKEREYNEMSSWAIIRGLTEKIKVRAYSSPTLRNDFAREIYFYTEDKDLLDGFRVRDYDYITVLKTDNDLRYEKEDPEKKEFKIGYSTIIDVAREKLELYYGDGLIETFDISESVIAPLLAKKEKQEDDMYGQIRVPLS
ncbi:hypothetical protein C0583_03560 [Candidatus Parcubacteria bacterium]|nr:MAG: hypothetical protein C0583_03560 [Candidatus Parcubacteria bacterium]